MVEKNHQSNASKRRLLVILPLVVFLALVGFFLAALYSGDPSKLPSVLIGKPVPEFNLPPIEKLVIEGTAVKGLSDADLKKGEVSVVNVWSSWCGPCRIEHPLLEKLKKTSGVPIYGINYKDKPADARRFLAQLGNPYHAVGADRSGRTALDWGVYGMPETFIVNQSGMIIYKHVGPIDKKVLTEKILPIINKARTETATSSRQPAR